MSARRRGGLFVPGGVAALAGCGGLAAAGLMLEAGARWWGAWRWSPYAAIVGAFACFALAAVQARRAKAGRRPVQRPARAVTRRSLRPALIIFHVGGVGFGALAGYGAYLLHQRDTGPHVAVTVTRCELVDPGPQSDTGPHDYCYGHWTYEGRSYVDKYVQGAGLDDEGHVLDATLHGDTAYSRDLETPLILLGVFGTASLLLAGLSVATWRRWRRAPPA
ncbi:MAG: hypothetical protein ACM31C_17860 [Acidobacteriota bacterium]